MICHDHKKHCYPRKKKAQSVVYMERGRDRRSGLNTLKAEQEVGAMQHSLSPTDLFGEVEWQ